MGKDVPVILGGIEASLRRTAHYDLLVRYRVLFRAGGFEAQTPTLRYAVVGEAAYRLAMGEPISEIRDVRNTAIIVKEALPGWSGGRIHPS